MNVMEKWTPQNRLKLIERLAIMALKSATGKWNKDSLTLIIILCNASNAFLELNRENFKEVLKNDNN